MDKKECIDLLNSHDVINTIIKYGQEANIQIPALTPPLISMLFGKAMEFFVHKYKIDRVKDKQGQVILFFDSEVQTQEEVPRDEASMVG